MISKNIEDTQKIARDLAEKLPSRVFALVGELGVGKTTFSQAFLSALGVKEKVTSPTFVIIKKYKNIYHIDCYRLKNPEELLVLDFEKILNNPQNILLIEWADKVKSLLPKETIWISFKHSAQENEREIVIE